MFANGTLNLFVAITMFVVVTAAGREWLVKRGIFGRVLTPAVAQFIAGAAGLALAVAFLIAVG